MNQRILTWAFYILFFFTPLFFLPLNNELFEYNKMMLVYGLTVIIVGMWIIKIINSKLLIIKKTPLDLPLMLFLLSQILSTIFSIDPHTSLWGYYSRSNGGLFSIISYILLFYAFVSNFKAEDLLKFLKSTLLGGLLVSVYAIPEHFGVSPSCIFLTGRVSADCWVQDVQARVFATLGQPNWLAAYLGMLIPLGFYFVLTSTKKLATFFYSTLTVIFYMAFTFTYSRGATLGLITGIVVFLLGYGYCHLERSERAEWRIGMTKEGKSLLSLLLVFILINLLFGSALTGDFRLIKQNAPPPRPGLTSGTISNTTQLESGGTESGQIRLIVWQGAVDIFRHYPIFGSGVETFAYSYYNFRPAAHNLVSEWDFLYNKAHNEYLNYLATTGLLGFLSYMAIILTFIVWVIKKIINYELTKNKKIDNSALLIVSSLLAGYVSYLIQNFVQFSVVMIALLFYLFPAFAFVGSDSTKESKLPKFLTSHFSFLTSIYKRPIYTKFVQIIIYLIVFYLLFSLIKLWYADTLFKKGNDYSDSGNPGRAYNYLTTAASLNKSEPLYRNDLGFAAASASVALADTDATTSADLKQVSLNQTEASLKISPKNLSLLRTAIRTYYLLSSIDTTFDQKTLEMFDKAITLAPTDPKLYYNKALVLFQMDKKQQAIEALQKTIELKPNYREAHLSLGDFLESMGEKDKAKEQFNIVLQLIPNDPDALKKLQELQK